MNILVTENLKKYYDMGEVQVKALDGISLSIQSGEFLAIVGSSGSGKSTLLHMLGGLDNPTSGRVVVDGEDISKMSKDELTIFRRRKIGFVFQNYNLLPLMNVYENIILPVRLDGIKPDKAFVDKIITMLGLGKKKYAMPNQLSGGQRQRAYLAAALAQDADALLLDEPASFLDPKHVHAMNELLKSLHAKGNLTIITVTHDLAQPLDAGGHVLVLRESRQVHFGPAGDLVGHGILEQAFGHDFCYLTHPKTGKTLVVA